MTRPVQWSQLCIQAPTTMIVVPYPCAMRASVKSTCCCLLIADMPGEQTPFPPVARLLPDIKSHKTARNNKKTPETSPPPVPRSLAANSGSSSSNKKHAKHTDANARRHNTIITITSSTCPFPCPSSPPQPPPQQRQPWSTGSPCRCRTAPGRPCRHSP